jgi:hypothetical protein
MLVLLVPALLLPQWYDGAVARQFWFYSLVLYLFTVLVLVGCFGEVPLGRWWITGVQSSKSQRIRKAGSSWLRRLALHQASWTAGVALFWLALPLLRRSIIALSMRDVRHAVVEYERLLAFGLMLLTCWFFTADWLLWAKLSDSHFQNSA